LTVQKASSAHPHAWLGPRYDHLWVSDVVVVKVGKGREHEHPVWLGLHKHKHCWTNYRKIPSSFLRNVWCTHMITLNFGYMYLLINHNGAWGVKIWYNKVVYFEIQITYMDYFYVGNSYALV
jgi:hypothetical protein